MWTPYNWLNNLYKFYVVAVVVSLVGENQPNHRKLAMYIINHKFTLTMAVHISSKMDCSSFKSGCGMKHIKAFKRRNGLGYI